MCFLRLQKIKLAATKNLLAHYAKGTLLFFIKLQQIICVKF